MSDERTATHPIARCISSTGASTLAARSGGGFGFERDKTKTDWFCMEHQPETYRGQPVRRSSE
jgi:hypothetical protein